MIPRDFKERILLGMHKQVCLSYLKWLKLGIEIDMFEILCVLIIYSRCEMVKRLESKCQLFDHTLYI